MLLVQLAQQVVAQALRLRRHRRGRLQVEDGRAGVAEVDALVARRQEAARPVARPVDRQRGVIAKDDVGGKGEEIKADVLAV